eukprot:CAMPEP_0182815714 /NCGR_PEP_ID=MMETSP0006_2-20121128/10537_1 /TAXON_ID=97485 /ORGANISM="Prymnesium parvum, Strain Texoma1" /LENGTH=142 /DNA_ID=CAMNT_0024941929 /DNA_START=70 /DNA_END=499 /DNA_ORIENTATION=-
MSKKLPPSSHSDDRVHESPPCCVANCLVPQRRTQSMSQGIEFEAKLSVHDLAISGSRWASRKFSVHQMVPHCQNVGWLSRSHRAVEHEALCRSRLKRTERPWSQQLLRALRLDVDGHKAMVIEGELMRIGPRAKLLVRRDER